jgi:protein-L-isoaspartate O-methyltransferase
MFLPRVGHPARTFMVETPSLALASRPASFRSCRRAAFRSCRGTCQRSPARGPTHWAGGTDPRVVARGLVFVAQFSLVFVLGLGATAIAFDAATRSSRLVKRQYAAVQVVASGVRNVPMRRGASAAAALLLAGLGGAALWWRKHPSACPYGQRFWVESPHPLITRRRLREALAPRAGETVLEIGPGTGYYSCDVARSLAPGGALHVLDLQQEMLDHTMRKARAQGVDNLVPRQGDARELPYDGATFDAAFLVAVLGEVPDPDAALRELRRVVRPGGRVVVGELFGDPHMVGERTLRRRATAAGLRFERRVGPRVGYFGVLRRADVV